MACSVSQVSDLKPLAGMQVKICLLFDQHFRPVAASRDATDGPCVRPHASRRTVAAGRNEFDRSNVFAGANYPGFGRTSPDEQHQNHRPQQRTEVVSAKFWKKYDAGEFGKPAPKKLAYLDPTFQQWVKATQALPAEKQIEAVSKKLMELNPGFDGRMERQPSRAESAQVENQTVTSVGFDTDKVADISPVQAFSGLTRLRASGSDLFRGGWSIFRR